jgi:hypothetical protein
MAARKPLSIAVVLVGQAFLFCEFPHPLYQVEIGAVGPMPLGKKFEKL